MSELEYQWEHLRTHAIRVFGDQAPSANLESDIIDVFTIHPAGVKTAIDYVANQWAQGKVTSPWGLLRSQCQRLIDTSQNTVATDERDRHKAIQAAETWIRNAGIHIDREQEIIDYLFGHAEFTPPIEFLEQLEQDTRGNPGRPMYGPLLEAAIVRTRAIGVEPLPDTQDGPLRHYRTIGLRNQMLELWHQERPKGELAEQQALERADKWKATHPSKNPRRPQPQETPA